MEEVEGVVDDVHAGEAAQVVANAAADIAAAAAASVPPLGHEPGHRVGLLRESSTPRLSPRRDCNPSL